MKTNSSEKFKSLLKGKYISHIHTNYTDGNNTVDDYCRWAEIHRYKGVVFTEHVRKDLDYDFGKFAKEVEEARQKFPTLEIWLGVEAKILPNGDLDIPEFLPGLQVVCIACHSFPVDVSLYQKTLKRVFKDSRWKGYVRIWAHPGEFLQKHNLLEQEEKLLEELAEAAVKEGIFIEKNFKYKLPPIQIISNIPEENMTTGSDAHSLTDLENRLLK